MKQFYLLAVALLTSFGLSAQIVYVDADATGAGDGSTWADAYTNLGDAVAGATDTDQIWIADGTYNQGSTVFIDKPLIIVGGFNGTETDITEADPIANPVILTGDVSGNDVVGDFDAGRDDNIRIIEIDSLVGELAPEQPSVLISGLNFVGGQADPYTDPDFEDPIDPSAGGALRTYSPTAIFGSTFSDCDGDYGAGPAFLVGANNSSVNGSVASGNRSLLAGVVYARTVASFTADGCLFSGNDASRGSVMGIGSPGIFVNDCLFDGNTAAGGRGQVSFLFCYPGDINQCTFTNNTTDLASCIYIVGDVTDPQDITNTIVDSCLLNGNTAFRFGGGITSLDGDFLVTNSEINNTVLSGDIGTGAFGGFIYQQGPGRAVGVVNSNITNNRGSLGGAIVARDSGSVLIIEGSNFEGNSGSTRGGAIAMLSEFTGDADLDLVPGAPSLEINNSRFFNNQADVGPFVGGAIFLQGNFTPIQASVDSSEFINNTAAGDGDGGAIFNLFGVELDVTNSYFGSNVSGSLGGALYGASFFNDDPRADTPDEQYDPAYIRVESSQFHLNTAGFQGGAVFTQGNDMDATNSEFYQNLVNGNDDGDGVGGALGLNGDSSQTFIFDVVNNTFVGNIGVSDGDQIAIFQDPLDPTDITTTELQLTNNAFFGFGSAGAVVVEDGANGDIVTNGGNFFTEMPDDFALDATDILEDGADETEYFVEALEVERNLIDLSLLPGTELINGGVVTADTPAEDINGTPRDAMPDIGADEAAGTVVDIAVASPVHTTLVSVLGTAGLVGTLQGDGPFTVFAPTDDAFANVDAGVLAILTDPANIDNYLTPTLLYHVVAGEVITTRDIANGFVDMATTVQGEDLSFSADNDGIVSVNHVAGVATIIVPNLTAQNGIVHVIDEVMVPMEVVDNLTATEDLADSGLDIKLFPNPVVEQLQVNALDQRIDNFDLSIVDMNGRRLSTYRLGNGSHTLDVTGLPTGMYTLEFMIEGEAYTTRIIKQ